MKKFLKIIVITSLFVHYIAVSTVTAQYAIPKKMEWWYEARFGMFIHFGSYSQFGHGEWVLFNEKWTKEEYQTKITSNFKPDNFSAKHIVDLAKAAGMRYIVITAKHHEGFAMWKTQAATFRDYKSEKIFDLYHYLGFERDLLKELKDECDKQGLKFCLYYSILDWNHSSQKAENYFSEMNSMVAKQQYVNQMKLQLKEIITQYHPAVVWFDGDWCKDLENPTLFDWWNKADAVDLYEYVTGLDSTIIVNERVKRDLGLGDFMCPEQKIPDTVLPRQWETCQTLNNTWGYDFRDSAYKPVSRLVKEIVQIVSRDGNYLLNIGPKGDGSIPEQTVSSLTEFGRWMSVYSDCIYGATRSPFATEPHWGYYTKKDGKLFIAIIQWPVDGKLAIPALSNTITKVYELSDKATMLPYSTSSDTITISLPAKAFNELCSVVVVEMGGIPTRK